MEVEGCSLRLNGVEVEKFEVNGWRLRGVV